MRDVILAAYLTGYKDPQRRTRWPRDTRMLEPLLDSTPAVVFADQIRAPYVVRVPSGRYVYFDRWRHVAKYLRENDDIRFAFAVDSTDVVMLNDPFPHMEPGKLYCGSEPQVLGCEWMHYHHRPMAHWLKENVDRVLLNCGLVGADRETLLRLTSRMTQERHGAVMDMGAFNRIAYEEFEVVTGSLVHTLYKAEQTESDAWFKHK